VHSRFGKHLAGGRFPVRYPGRARRDRRLLSYTSEPLSEDTEVTGHPTVSLCVIASEDGAIFVYLEDVAPEGVVRTVTDGALRFQARAIRQGSWPYWALDPYRPYLRSDAQEVVPGRMELRFDLFPISWLFRAGHAIRVAIAGADRDNFLRVLPGDPPLIAVGYGPNAPSQIQLPVMARLAE
jgi:putative CocE/NonD family hydrolase